MKCWFELSNSLSLRVRTREWQHMKKQEPAELKQNSNPVLSLHSGDYTTALLYKEADCAACK